MGESLPYWRLSGFYFFYFSSLGTLIPYWGLYLKDQGFTEQSIGELAAIIMATKIIAPNLWGWLADHTGRHIMLARFGSLLSFLCFLGVFAAGNSYFWLVFVMGSFSFFWNATLPQIEATTLHHLGKNAHRYTHIRLWGSIGFILAVSGIGWFLSSHSVTWIPILLAGFFGSIWLCTLMIPEQITELNTAPHPPIRQILLNPSVIALFTVCFLMQISHGPYYTFYTLYLEKYNYARDTIGQLWALGVVAEIITFTVLHRLLTIFTLRALLITSFVLTSIRWTLIGAYPDWFSVILFAQLFHAASFGLFHGVAIQFIHRYFVSRHQGQAQALYTSLGFGAGGAIGSFMSGYTWAQVDPHFTYFAAAIICIVAVWVSWRWLKEESISKPVIEVPIPLN